MSTINRSSELDDVIHDPEELRGRSRSPLFFVVAILAGLVVTATLLGGYYYLRSRHAAQTFVSEQQQSAPTNRAVQPEVKIFEDQAMIKGAQAVIVGTMQNISNVTLADLSLELELTRRDDGAKEARTLALAPKDLAPNEQGRYSLTVLSREFKQVRVVRVLSGTRPNEVAFATAPGAQRPPGPPPQTNKTIIVNRPRTSNSDFINTPDNPTTIP